MKVLIFFSGGKDSQASLIWAVNEYGLKHCEAVFCDTGHEHPQTITHIYEVVKQMGVKLTILKSQKHDGMFDLVEKKGRFPSLTARFCTEELKTKPAIDYVLSHTEHLIIIEGIRKNESLSRSKMDKACTYFKYYFEPYGHDKYGKAKLNSYRKKDVIQWCQSYNADKLRPIFDWTAEQTIQSILQAGQLPNPLYYQGFKRVGCFPCVHASQKEVSLIIANHPEQWQQIKAEEKRQNSGFFKPDYIPKRFCSNNLYPTGQDIEAYLTRNDAQIDAFESEVGCMSVYNLCE